MGARSLLWTAAAAALPVVVVVLVLVVLTLGGLLFTAHGFDSLFAVVAVEWLVVNLVPLTVDDVALGFLPLLPALIYGAVLARQTRVVLADLEEPGPREAGAAVTGVVLASVLLTVLASLIVGSADSDFAVRPAAMPAAIGWTLLVAVIGSGLGVWLFFRGDLRESLPLWVRGGLHLGAAFTAATWAIATLLVLLGLLVAWVPVGNLLGIGKDFVGTASLTAISVAYLPNLVALAATVVVGGEAHLGEASFSVFAVSRGPLPEVPLAAVLPTTNPHWSVQLLLLVTALVAAGLARSVAHWFRTTADAVRATWLGAAVVALVIAVTPLIAGGRLGALGTVGTGSLIAAGTALAIFGVIGSATIILALAGLTRRRERAESELERRRHRAGTGVPEAGADTETESEPEPEPESEVDEPSDESPPDDDEVVAEAEPDDVAADEAEHDPEVEPEPEAEPDAELKAESDADDEPGAGDEPGTNAPDADAGSDVAEVEAEVDEEVADEDPGEDTKAQDDSSPPPGSS